MAVAQDWLRYGYADCSSSTAQKLTPRGPNSTRRARGRKFAVHASKLFAAVYQDAMAPSILLFPALCFAVAADEPLLLRLGQSMDRFYAEHRHHAFRQRLEKHPRFASPAGSDAVARWQAWLRRCSDEACSCNAVPVEGANGVLREPCDCAPLPSSVGQIGRTLRLGRVLWCIAAAGDVSVAADFYANEGGSASLLAHGLSQHAASEPRRLWTFEVQADWAASTARSLQAAGADVSLVKPAWSGSAAQEALLKEARGGEPRAAVRAIVVAEAPAFHHDASEEAASEALLQAPCMEKPGIQFAFIDPLEAFVPEFSILFTSCPDLKWIAEVTCPIFLMNDDELQQKIDRLVKLVSENVPESGANETEPADPGQGNLRASREASPKRDEASWLVGMDDIRRIEATSSKATPSSSSKVPSSAVQAVPTSSRRFWGPSLTAAVKANQRRLVASKPAPRQEASHEGEEGRDEFAVSPEARKALASIGRSLETGDLHSWELHNAARGLTRKLLTATVDDAIILEESETWQGIRMGAAVPDLDVRVSLPISRALHAIPEGRAVVGQLVTALVLLRLHGLEPASIGRAKRKATDRLLRQSLSEYMTKKKEKKDKKQKKEKVEKKEKKEKKKAKRADKELDKERTKKAKIASKGAAKAAKVGAGEARPVGSQVGRQDLASLKSEVVRELRQRPMTLQTLNSLFGCRLKEATKSMGQQIKFKKWLLEIDDVKWGGKKGNPLLTWKPTSQTPADKRSRSRSPRRAPDPPPGNFGAALNPQW
ncbi:hypothetical protein AK812_SmicGene43 [Symbiodinium microadriaticum]|uniref:Uncharacterized protein n=1 Tax=Symbiodinium microadriaticum TaxID=2951 RepID=A0A1Q9F7I0_SYMMI|nr:hypothetical protein AK812_SmicGene43 [Symbiodinium microadriaticum]